ncbi:EF-hand domain-containing protein (plasmid) [Leisingera sp. M527]|uniref:EF-hand domain-containing protein n=1 Tax=Leisingera sp. M527 TaxID=2867014 RepID=UPI0021A4CFD8|nr:EF-hand domain-containing protein [Leisingera sp. M527]UWQ35402.1 EF-hand domain-containing protein [Leisingera sp. M527]
MKTQILITAMIAAVALPAYADGGSLKAMDLNRDGKVTVSEAVEARVAKFDGADTDGNGSLDKGEHTAMLEALSSQCKRGDGAKRTGNADPFSITDADGSGSISKAEFRSVAEQFFTRVDADGNGKLTRSDFRALRSQKSG